FGLYRAQYVVIENNQQVNFDPKPSPGYPSQPIPMAQLPLYKDISCTSDPNSGNIYFNTPADLATGKRSINLDASGKPGKMPPLDPTDLRAGSLLIDDVISFEVVGFNREVGWDKKQWPYVQQPDPKPPQARPPLYYNSYDPGVSWILDGVRI